VVYLLSRNAWNSILEPLSGLKAPDNNVRWKRVRPCSNFVEYIFNIKTIRTQKCIFLLGGVYVCFAIPSVSGKNVLKTQDLKESPLTFVEKSII